MISLIIDNKQAIAALCRKYGIKRLDVFGSAATGTFDPDSSDIDFIVDLGEYDDSVAERYLDLIAALTDVLGYRVEMITEPSIRNPYFRAAVDEQRVTVYEASNGKAAA
jgi:predicted nucleotidyltransferase